MLPASRLDLNAVSDFGNDHRRDAEATRGNGRAGLAEMQGQLTLPVTRLSPIMRQAQGSASAASVSQGQRSTTSPASSVVSLTSNTVLRKRQGLSKAAVPFGALITPLPDLTGHSLPLLQRSPTACTACGACMNAHCKVLMREDKWLCSFCQQPNDVEVGVQDLRSAPELRVEAVDYFQQDMTGQPVKQTAETLAVLVDTTAGTADLQAAKAILKQVGQTGTCPTADVVSGHWQPAAATKGKHQQQQHADLPIRSPEPLHIAALQSCQETAEQIIDCWRSLGATGASREQPRCLGSALAVALQLLAAGNQQPAGLDSYALDSLPVPQACRPSRVLLITTGPATKGPGSVPLNNLDSRQGPDDPQATKQAHHFFQQAALQAVQAGVAVDVVAVGQAAVNVPLLGPLAQKTGGLVMTHQRFDELSGAGLASALMRRQGIDGFLDIHTSTGLGVTHITGPLTPLGRTNLSSNSMQRHNKPTMNACEMVSVETGQGIAVGLEVSKELQGDYAYLQVILSWRSLEGGWLQRVVSRRLSTTGSLQTVITGTDWSAAAVLAGKHWVRQAQATGAGQNRRAAQHLRTQIGQHVSQVVSQAAGGPSTWGALTWLAPPPPAVLPPYLHNFAQVMYQLQRGPMLGDVAGHADERALLHAWFLAASSPVALLMMAPALYLSRPGTAASFQQVQALDLALQPGDNVVLDCGNQIFIRPGPASEAKEGVLAAEAATEALLEQLTQHRVPAPGLVRLHQDSSDMRYLAARLMPTWQDSPQEQQQLYPALLSLTADQALAVQQQRMPTDEPSFNAWARLLRISPTGAVDNLMEAMENMSVTKHAKQHSKLLEDEARIQAEPVEV